MVSQTGLVTRRRFVRAASGGILAAPSLLIRAAATPPLFPQLSRLGPRFTFAVIADPQLEGARTPSDIYRTSARRFDQIIDELNRLRPAPAFVVINGDAVNRPIPSQMRNFLERARRLRPLTILVHGNHDGDEPWSEFRSMQKALNGSAEVRFAFDAGPWRMLAIPTNFSEDEPFAARLLEWVEVERRGHPGRPTLLFAHYPLLPQGLSQFEWYTYRRPFRTRLLEGLTARRPTDYVFHGHVHNGIQASDRIGWRWRGTRFLTVPTCTASRNFGEEYPQFQAGTDQHNGDTGGGFYVLCDVQGPSLRVRGRLVGCPHDFIFDAPPEYRDQEPLWFQSALDLPAQDRLENGSFAEGLRYWHHPWRYRTQVDPGFVSEPRVLPDGTTGWHLGVREKGQAWSQDETLEVYQALRVPAGQPPLFHATYRVDTRCVEGGGYFRLAGFAGRTLRLLCFLHWNRAELGRARNLIRTSMNTLTEAPRDHRAFAELGECREALFVPLPEAPGEWHRVAFGPASALIEATGDPEAFARLHIDRWLVAPGVWSLETPGAQSQATFTDLGWTVGPPGWALVLNGQPIAGRADWFQTGLGVEDRRRPDPPAVPGTRATGRNGAG